MMPETERTHLIPGATKEHAFIRKGIKWVEDVSNRVYRPHWYNLHGDHKVRLFYPRTDWQQGLKCAGDKRWIILFEGNEIAVGGDPDKAMDIACNYARTGRP